MTDHWQTQGGLKDMAQFLASCDGINKSLAQAAETLNLMVELEALNTAPPALTAPPGVCGDCRFWTSSDPPAVAVWGECRKAPPVLLREYDTLGDRADRVRYMTRWPHTRKAAGWCGEFKAKTYREEAP